MASKLLIYLSPIIVLLIFLYLSTGVDGQQSQGGAVFLFDRNNRNLERRRNNQNQRRTEEERALRRQQRLNRQRGQQNNNRQTTHQRTPAPPPSHVNPNQQRVVTDTQRGHQTHHQPQPQPQPEPHPQPQPRPQTVSRQSDPRITTEYVWQRLQALEKRVTTAMRHLTQQQQKITEIESRGASPQRVAAPAPGPMMGAPVKKFSEEPRCPNGAEGYYHAPQFGSCYHLEPNDVYVNWTDGSEICRRTHRQAHLVAIETQAEHEYLKAKWMVERGIATISRFWTSGMKKNGRWRWESTRRVIGPFTNWIPTTAHNDDNFNCIAVFSNEAYYWGDVACWHPHLVTCEIRL